MVCKKLAPRVIIPMHFKNDRCPTFPVAGVEDFTQTRQQVKTIAGSEIELKKEQLPSGAETMVLKPAL